MVDQSSDLKLDQDGNPIRLLQGCLITVTAPLRISFLVSKILAGKLKKRNTARRVISTLYTLSYLRNVLRNYDFRDAGSQLRRAPS
jgi:hypothetical protein